VGAQPAHVPRIGVLAAEGGIFATPQRSLAEFREALRERGYVERQTIRVDSRSVAAGQTDRLNDLAGDLVRLPFDLIVTLAIPAAQAAKRVTTALSIVFNAGDPVSTGLVASLAQPGGNATGISGIGLSGKCFDLLRDLLPTMTHVAVLVHVTDSFARPFLEHIESAAKSASVRIQPIVVRGAEEFDGAFTAMVTEGAGAVIIQPFLATPRAAALAVQHHLPTMPNKCMQATPSSLRYAPFPAVPDTRRSAYLSIFSIKPEFACFEVGFNIFYSNPSPLELFCHGTRCVRPGEGIQDEIPFVREQLDKELWQCGWESRRMNFHACHLAPLSVEIVGSIVAKLEYGCGRRFLPHVGRNRSSRFDLAKTRLNIVS
jgi:hypothetical protein